MPPYKETSSTWNTSDNYDAPPGPFGSGHDWKLNVNRIVPFLILCVLQLGDYISTRLAFKAGAVEGNPLVHALGLWETKVLACAIIALIAWKTTRPKRLWAICAVYVLVVASNLLIAHKP